MLDLSEGSLAAWQAKLPDDLRAALADGEGASIGSGTLSAALAEVAPWQVPELVRNHPEDARAFGRARRVRLMAWMAKQTYPESAAVLRRLTGEETDGADDGAGEVGVLFLEDLRALRDALAQRIARRMTFGANLESVVQAAFVIESDAEFRQGGL